MNDAGGWRYVCASVAGVAHLAGDADCQDACAAQLVSVPERGPVLVLAVADGAGSAAQTRVGAELACRTLLAECAARATDAGSMDWTRTDAEALLHSVRTALARQAADAGLPVREFACTLLGAVVAADRALFLQIGDGAIVIGAESDYRPVFWPQTGEYANETRFATDPDAVDHLEWTALAEPVAEIALLTDGLQRLALHYRQRQAHAPFFRPMFQHLREYPEPGCPVTLATALERFLASPAVNQRTHDDKTLILATRLPAVECESPPVPTELDATAPTGTTAAPDATTAAKVADDLSDTDPEVAHADAAPARPDSATTTAPVREHNGDEAV